MNFTPLAHKTKESHLKTVCVAIKTVGKYGILQLLCLTSVAQVLEYKIRSIYKVFMNL